MWLAFGIAAVKLDIAATILYYIEQEL